MGKSPKNGYFRVRISWFGALFFHICPFDRGVAVCGLKLFGQCPYRINTFHKGASLTVRRGVVSGVQLSCTETRFQKCSQSGKMVVNTHCYHYLWLTMCVLGMVYFRCYLVIPHVQAVQNVCSKGGVEGVLGRVTGGRS